MNNASKQTKTFINRIFTSLASDEHVLFWGSAKSSPGLPATQENFFKRTLRPGLQKACYFSTATAHMGEDENKKPRVFNRQNLFSRMFCIVLDDIGSGIDSKCLVSDLPEILQAEYSWRIETSKDNFQYGF